MEQISPTDFSAKSNKDNIVQFFLDRGINYVLIDPNFDHIKEFKDAIKRKSLVELKNAVEHGFNLDLQEGLYEAILNKWNDGVKYLVDHGADIGHYRITEILNVSKEDIDEDYDLDIIKILVENGANVNTCGTHINLLSHANYDICKHLIEKGADPNRINYDGENPLRMNTMSGNFEVVRLLIENGADFNYNICYHGECQLSNFDLELYGDDVPLDYRIVGLFLDHRANFTIGSADPVLLQILVSHVNDIYYPLVRDTVDMENFLIENWLI